MAIRFSEKYREAARELVKEKLTHFNQFYNFKFNKVFIKRHKRRWGSCSSKRNLNFNYKIIFLPPTVADYLIVHELCHLQELNHSQKVWELVGRTIKNYKKLNKALKKTIVS